MVVGKSGFFRCRHPNAGTSGPKFDAGLTQQRILILHPRQKSTSFIIRP
jgi:hypothetical protein